VIRKFSLIQFIRSSHTCKLCCTRCHRRACKYQVLSATKPNSYRNTQNTWNSLWNEALSHTHIFAWFKRFVWEHKDPEDGPRCGQMLNTGNLETGTNAYRLVYRDSNDPKTDGG